MGWKTTNKEEAEKLGFEAKQKDVWLSVHGSYFINFCGAKNIVEASKKRLIACATAAEWMKAHVVVFHPGYYGDKSQKRALKSCKLALSDVVESMRALKITNVKIGPETTGKTSQLGSLDEILSLCEEIEQTQLVIDRAHLHARDMGCFRTADDFRNVIETVEKHLGLKALRHMHCHFTKIEYTYKGERRHHILDNQAFGPDFKMLARIIAEYEIKPVIISESPILDLDAIKMQKILRKELKKTKPVF